MRDNSPHVVSGTGRVEQFSSPPVGRLVFHCSTANTDKCFFLIHFPVDFVFPTALTIFKLVLRMHIFSLTPVLTSP